MQSPAADQPSSSQCKRKAGEGWEEVHYDKRGKRIKCNARKYPDVVFSPSARLHRMINIGDLRDIVTYVLANTSAPQWVAIKHRAEVRKFVVVMVFGLEMGMFEGRLNFTTYAGDPLPKHHVASPDDYYPKPLEKDQLADEVKPFAEMFPYVWPVNAPGDTKTGKLHSATTAFFTTPLSRSEKALAKQQKALPLKPKKTPITKFLTSIEDMKDQRFPIHPAMLSKDRRETFVKEEGFVYSDVGDMQDGEVSDSEIEQGSITVGRHVLAVDCEMVKCGSEYVLARITVLNWDGDTVMDELVKPAEPVTDYVTRFSGIDEDMLRDVKTNIRDIQRRLKEIVTPRTILVGHSLESDLSAMKFSHPFTVDTSLIFPHPSPSRKNKLKELTRQYLRRSIQEGEHDSREDARATLDLVSQKCVNGPSWGVPDAAGINLFQRLSTAGTVHDGTASSFVAAAHTRRGNKTAIVDWNEEATRGPGSMADIKISCTSDAEVEAGVMRAVQGDSDGHYVPGGGVDFVFARFRELEKHRGWKNTSGSRLPEPSPSPVSRLAKSQAQQGKSLSNLVSGISSRLQRVYDSLPACTMFMVMSGGGNPQHQNTLFRMKMACNKEGREDSRYSDHYTASWTELDDKRLSLATQVAKHGVGFIAVK